MKNKIRAWLTVFCALGLIASAASAYVHYRLLQDSSYTSFCDISESVNCETVYRSQYGSIGGVPVALGGVLWFAMALLLTFAAEPAAVAGAAPSRKHQPPPQRESTVCGYLFLLSTAALAVVLYLAYASFFVLKTMCVLCVLTYVAVIGIFVLSGSAGPARLMALPSLAARDLRRLVRHPVALTIALLYLAGAASAVAFFPRETASRDTGGQAASRAVQAPPAITDDRRTEFERWMGAQPRVPLAVPTDGAVVLIVKFNDYQCPPCRQTFMEYKPIVAKYQASHPGKVKLVTKDFPLEAECNTGGAHQASCEAAAAVRMARAKGRAEALEDWLFDNQPAMTPALVRQGLSQVAGISDFDAQYPRVLEQVRADVALGRQLGVNRTPTFFINGVKVEGGLLAQFFDAAIAYELKRGQASQP